MTQLFCDGVALDLLAGAAFDFQKENALFAFDDLKMERTASFSLPATPTNNGVFALASEPWTSGTVVRKRLPAQLVAGYVVKTGFLFVTSFEGGQYKAIFTTGELLPLYNIKNAGKLADLVPADVLIDWTAGATIVRADAVTESGTQLLQRVQYRTNAAAANIVPAYAFGKVLKDIANRNAWRITWPADAWQLYAVFGELQGAKFSGNVVSNNVVASINSAPQDANTLDAEALGNLVDVQNRRVGYIRTGYTTSTETHQFEHLRQFNVKIYRALQSLTLTFPDDFPADYFVCDLPGTDTYYTDDSPQTFYGDYSFKVYYVEPESGQTTPTRYEVTGAPLAGRSVEIPAGAAFVILNKLWYRCEFYALEDMQGKRYTYWQRGYWLNAPALTYSISVAVEGGAVVFGNRLRLLDNLPDISYVEALKVVANASGLLLNYSDASGVTFEALDDLSAWPVLDITGRTYPGRTIARTFGAYAQRNDVAFDTNDAVPQAERLRVSYTLENESLDEEKALFTFPFSEGANIGGDVYISADVETGEAGLSINNGQRATLAKAGTDTGQYLDRLTLPANDTLKKLVTNSTKVEVRARLTLAEYNGITAKTLILYDGLRYVWTAATWSAGVAKFTLAKVVL